MVALSTQRHNLPNGCALSIPSAAFIVTVSSSVTVQLVVEPPLLLTLVLPSQHWTPDIQRETLTIQMTDSKFKRENFFDCEKLQTLCKSDGCIRIRTAQPNYCFHEQTMTFGLIIARSAFYVGTMIENWCLAVCLCVCP